MRILVTAIGGDIGYGIGKILRMTDRGDFLIGCDVHHEHAGRLYFDRCEIVPRADSDAYVDTLLRLVRELRIDLVIPTSEPELRHLLEKGLSDKLEDTAVLAANAHAMRIGFDKLRTARVLEEVGLPFPWTSPVRGGQPAFLPCIVKSRFGAGSKGFAVVEASAVQLYAQVHGDGIWQELLEPAEQEYTCGLYRSAHGETRTIVFHRKLVAGVTTYGRVVAGRADIEQLLVRVADFLELEGSVNVQLMLTPRGPIVFEINPRFSSTVVFRHRLGFQDVLWSILEKQGRPLPAYAPPPNGTAFYRGVDELLLPAEAPR